MSWRREREEEGSGARVTAHAVNPGLSPTEITRELSTLARASYFGAGAVGRTVGHGAATTLHCCVAKVESIYNEGGLRGGRYYEGCAEVEGLWSDDDDTDDGAAAGTPQPAAAEGGDGAGGERSLAAAARLWALSEWMVQPETTWHEAHSHLYDVVEEPEPQEEQFEKVFDKPVSIHQMLSGPLAGLTRLSSLRSVCARS